MCKCLWILAQYVLCDKIKLIRISFRLNEISQCEPKSDFKKEIAFDFDVIPFPALTHLVNQFHCDFSRVFFLKFDRHFTMSSDAFLQQ